MSKEEQKRISRRRFLRLAGGMAAGAALAACQPQTVIVKETVKETVIVEGTPKVVEKEVEVTRAPVTKEPVSLRYQLRSGGQDPLLWETFYEYFYGKYPHITVENFPHPGGGEDGLRETLISQMVAGDAPDVYQLCCWTSTIFVQNGQALNLQPYIDAEADEVNIDDFSSQQFIPWTLNGDIHFYPYYTGTFHIYYNKDWFDEAGVAYPPSKLNEWPFQDYFELLKQFVSREDPITWGSSNYGWGANWLTQCWLRANDANMVNLNDNTECMLCSNEAMETLEMIRQAVNEFHSFAYGEEMAGSGVTALFSAERIAMKEMGSWDLRNTVEQMPDINWDIAPYPNSPKGVNGSHQSTDGQGAWSESPHKDEAWALVKEIGSAAFEKLNITYGKLQPSRKSVLPLYVDGMRRIYPKLEEVNLEIFQEGIEQDLGGVEEMFRYDVQTKTQILKPAFDKVILLNEAPVELICQAAEIATKFNRDEIAVEDIGSEMAKIGL